MITTPSIGEAARAARRRRNTRLAGVPTSDGEASLDFDELIALVCECRRPSCGVRVSLPRAVFHGLVESGGLWVISPGHVAADEYVFASSAGYWVTVPRTYAVELEPDPAD